MQARIEDWKIEEADQRFRELLAMAKASGVQCIEDADGFFEVRFVSGEKKERAGDVLARGGPSDD